jgi:hypothetical protein
MRKTSIFLALIAVTVMFATVTDTYAQTKKKKKVAPVTTIVNTESGKDPFSKLMEQNQQLQDRVNRLLEQQTKSEETKTEYWDKYVDANRQVEAMRRSRDSALGVMGSHNAYASTPVTIYDGDDVDLHQIDYSQCVDTSCHGMTPRQILSKVPTEEQLASGDAEALERYMNYVELINKMRPSALRDYYSSLSAQYESLKKGENKDGDFARKQAMIFRGQRLVILRMRYILNTPLLHKRYGGKKNIQNIYNQIYDAKQKYILGSF